MGVIYLDRQHSGKPGRRVGDRGATADLDGDGVKEVNDREAMLTPVYLLACEERLLEFGHAVIPISDGWYSDRHQRVNEYAGGFPKGTKQIYVAAHLNAGGGKYGAIFYDHRSRRGPELAARIAKELRLVAPELTDVRSIGATPDNWTRNAYATIGGVVQPVGLCVEPAFMDTPEHQDLLGSPEGLRSIGYAIANGIHHWISSP